MAKTYINSVVAAGGTPLLVPVIIDNNELRRIYDLCDGVLLAGGSDCDPKIFGEDKHEKTKGIDLDRDRAEIILTQWANEDNKALFGICRGMQMMNVALGGSLIQDIPSQWQTNLVHQVYDVNPDPNRAEPAHATTFANGSRISHIVGIKQIMVNSFHHQAVKRAADGFVITSYSPDGIVESFEKPDKRFSLGVQWHPEDMASERNDMMNLFRAFVAATRNPS
jgi:putative glutamine amidotransferase